MKRARLADGLDVTAIGLGTAPLGGLFAPVSEEDAEATIERAWSLGVRFFDTAPLYGFGIGRAASRRFSAPAKAGFIRDLDQGRAPAALGHRRSGRRPLQGNPRRAAAIRFQL